MAFKRSAVRSRLSPPKTRQSAEITLKLKDFKVFSYPKAEKSQYLLFASVRKSDFEVYPEIMLAKRTPITQQEKEKMWQLYNELVSFPKLAKKLNRSPDTVSRYVHEYEAAVNAVCVVIDAQNT